MEYLDNTVKSAEEVGRYTSLPTLGVVPAFGNHSGYRYYYSYGSDKNVGKNKKKQKKEEHEKPENIELIAHLSPESAFSENYRSLRTALLLSGPQSNLKTIMVTSPLPGEGKSTTISNLAISFTQMGKKVLIIDADLRKPKQHQIFKMKNHEGLTSYLAMDLPLEKLIKSAIAPSLYLINSGPIPPNPAELLGSDKMARLLSSLKNQFDFILIDTPPILTVTDAQIVGKLVDGLVLVVRAEKTPRNALVQTRELIDLFKLRTFGVVINGLNIDSHDYYSRHYYHHYYKEYRG